MSDKSSQAAGQVFEPNRPYKPLHVLGRRLKTKALVTRLKAATEPDMPPKAGVGAKAPRRVRFPSASAWRKRGEIVESERLHVSSPALPSDRAEVSPNLRVLMFASVAGGDALKQDDTGHWGRGGVG
jgi:hypothetical protein